MNMSTQLPRLDRQESMFRQGRSFQPAPGSLGQVALANPGALRRGAAFVGQVVGPTTTSEVPPPADAEKAPEAPVQPKTRPGLRLAWGRLKKLDAQQLAEALAAIVERLNAKGMPTGMVGRIQDRLAQFSQRASTVDTVEITEPEVQQMEAEILSLEEAEAKDQESSATPLLILAGTLATVGILSALFGD